MPTFETLQDDYARLWSTMEIRAERTKGVTLIAQKLLAHKAIYQEVETATGVPWFVIAALHERESGADFSTYLGNGEPLNQVTRLVPRGRGPFATWPDGAIDALKVDHLDEVRDWTAARACYEIEKFNGFGYRDHHAEVKSPYLWSFSNHYTQGKYIADGRFDIRAVDQQCGAIPIVKRIMELDATARFTTGRMAEKAATTVVIAGAAMAAAQSNNTTAMIIVVVAIVVAIGAWFIIRKLRSKP